MLGITAHFRRQDGKSVDPPVPTFDRSGYVYEGEPSATQLSYTRGVLGGDVNRLMYAFTWVKTPQGQNHWDSIYRNREELLPEDKDYIEWLLEEYDDELC